MDESEMSALKWAQSGMHLGQPLKGQVADAAARVCPAAFAAAMAITADPELDVITSTDVVDALRACGVLP